MGFQVLPSSVTAVTAVGVDNTSFAPSVQNVTQKIVIIGSALAAKAGTYVVNVPQRVYSPDQVGAIAGFGSPPHRAAIYTWKGTAGGVEVYLCLQAETGTAVVATGGVEFTAVPTESGTAYIYIAGELYDFGVTADDTLTTLGDKLVARMAEKPECPHTGVNTVGVVVFTCKSLGTWGNDCLTTANELPEQQTPAGLAYTITAMTGGLNDPEIEDVLTALGTGDDANEDFFTKYVPCYGTLVTGTMDSLSVYNGTGNVQEGCYSETVHRPFVAVFGDTGAGSSGLTAITAIGTARRELDRTNGAISVPGSPNHPVDIAAAAAGVMSRMGNVRAEETYVGQTLPGILLGAKADRWNRDYTSRDAAGKAGISPTENVNGVVKMLNMLTFYHPESVPIASNGYRSMRNIAIMTNQMDSFYLYYNSDAWKGITIVENVVTVTSMLAREKVRDINSVLNSVFALADLYQGKAWTFSAEWIKTTISENVSSYISIRAGGLGFDIILPNVLPGEGGIINGEIKFDTNLAVVTG